MLKIATIAAALMLPAAASAEMSQKDKAEMAATIMIHGERCETRHTDFINRLEKIYAQEHFDELTAKNAIATVLGYVKQEGTWGQWCRRTTGLFLDATLDRAKQLP